MVAGRASPSKPAPKRGDAPHGRRRVIELRWPSERESRLTRPDRGAHASYRLPCLVCHCFMNAISFF